jgi:hypothetical protein
LQRFFRDAPFVFAPRGPEYLGNRHGSALRSLTKRGWRHRILDPVIDEIGGAPDAVS